MTAETARDLLAQPADRWLYAITDAKVHAYTFPAYDRAPPGYCVAIAAPGDENASRRCVYLGGNRIEECSWLPSSG